MKRRSPRFYFSYRSPFSWITAKWLEEHLLPEERAAIEYIPYWEPDDRTQEALRQRGAEFLYQQMSREKHLYILQDVKRLTKELGYTHVWPIDDKPWWELPNLAYFAACRHGRGEAFRKAAYHARWERGENIHTLETVRRLATELGLDADELANAHEDDAIRAQAADSLTRAYNDGAFGVPFFVNGHEKFWGVDRLRPFIDSLRGRSSRYLFLDH